MLGIKLTSPSKLRKAGIMGMNRRNYDVIGKHNKRNLYPLVDNKVKTKALANEIGINTPALIGVIEFQYQVKEILKIIGDYREFVIKPAQGSGGKGVLVIKEWDGENKFITASGRQIGYKEIYQHISNTLSGLYSLGGQYDAAIIEELVHFSPIFENFSFQGVPDVRIIVYRGIPAMAMMRLPTKSSEGRANLHQGAVGVGLDIKTGHPLNAVMRNVPIRKHPDTDADLMNLQVPDWESHLEIASKAFDMVKLGYLGADIVLDEFRGPMMLELNARPGLAIQIANGKGLVNVVKEIDKNFKDGLNWKERIEFVKGLNFENIYK